MKKTNKTIKAILFDLDDTLAEYHDAEKFALKQTYQFLNEKIALPYNTFLKQYNLSKLEIFRELKGTPSAYSRTLYFRRLLKKLNISFSSDLILKLQNIYWSKLLKKVHFKKGAKELLNYLQKNKIKIAIVTDAMTYIQLKKINKLKMDKYIDILVTWEECFSEKPDPRIFLVALHKLNCTPQEVLMVGDNLNADIAGANFLGIETVYFKNKWDKAKIREENKHLAKPIHIIKNLSELKKIIQKRKKYDRS